MDLDLCITGFNETELNIVVYTDKGIQEMKIYDNSNRNNLSLEQKTLAISSCYGSVGIINDYIYLYGGEKGIGGWQYNGIQKAPISDPTNWVDTGYTLSKKIGWTHPAVIINDSIYLFGSVADGRKMIFSAPLSNPANMTDTGVLLPKEFYGGYVEVIDNKVYLFGVNTNEIYSSPVSNPTSLTYEITAPFSFQHMYFYR